LHIDAQQKEADTQIIVTDRPSFSASSQTVPYKSLQIETGYLINVNNSVSSIDFGSTVMSFPTPMIRWGVFKGVELRLFNTLFIKRLKNPVIPIDERSQFGFGNLVIGTKINITKAKGIIPEMAVLSHVTFPTGDAAVRNSEKTVFDITLSMTYPLSNKLSMGYNLGWTSVESNNNGDGIYSLIFGYGISNKFSVFIEGFGFWKNFESGTFSLDGGVSYLLKPNLQFDIAGGNNFTQRSYYITVGFSMLFVELY
jgi:hypothetical protein